MADMVRGWHASGRILELETKWGVANTPFAKRMHEQWRYYETGK
jgi:polar amino acid transport system substrate-binding protein